MGLSGCGGDGPSPSPTPPVVVNACDDLDCGVLLGDTAPKAACMLQEANYNAQFCSVCTADTCVTLVPAVVAVAQVDAVAEVHAVAEVQAVAAVVADPTATPPIE